MATLPSWGYYFELSLQLWIESLSDGWNELLKFTSTENDCCSPGDRIPALWLKAGFIRVASQVGSNGNFHKDYYIKTKTWTEVVIKQYPENEKVL